MSVQLALAEIDNRGRFHFPKEIWDQSSWLSKQTPGFATAILDEPGMVRLLAPVVWEKEVLPRTEALQHDANSDPAAEDELFRNLGCL